MRSLRLLVFFFKPYRWQVAGILVSSILLVTLEAFSTVVVYPMTTAVLGQGAGDGASAGVMASVGAIVTSLAAPAGPAGLLGLFAISYIAVVLAGFSRSIQGDILARVVTRDFQSRLFAKYLSADYQYLLDQQHGTMLFRIITAPQYMTVMFSAIPTLIVNVMKLLAVWVVLLLFSVRLTLMMGFLGVLFYVGLRLVSQRTVYRNSSRMQQGHERLSGLANESIAGIRELKIHRIVPQCIDRFSREARELSRLYVRNDVIRGIPATALQVTFMLGLLAALTFGTAGASLTAYVPLIAVYVFAFMRLAPSLADIASMRTLISERLPYAEAVYRELTAPSQQIRDGVETAVFRRSIRFDRATFSYPGREETLRDVSLTFDKGTTTAIVGPSGSGKTTVINLLVGLFELREGAIFVDDLDLRRIRTDTWLRKVGYVGQDAFLLNATVAENIAFGSEGASPAAIESVARAANAHGFIETLPQGYRTVLGDRGVKLSGGQRQRIAIARALLHEPEVLVFDEATSALDSMSEADVQVAITGLARSRTIIVIAHRLSTIRAADRIYVLDCGSVAETGTHEALIAARGLYYRLYRMQEEQFSMGAERVDGVNA